VFIKREEEGDIRALHRGIYIRIDDILIGRISAMQI